MKNKLLFIALALFFLCGTLLLFSCTGKQTNIHHGRSEVKHVEWSKNAVIYEANIRQYSKEGTFKAFEKDLSRIKSLGIDIIWIMPVNPIGEKNRKGKLGSYYSVKDYRKINPEFGTIDNFKSLVKEIHNFGMKVIIDWVPNHTSWDNVLVTSHPEYYMKDSTGKFVSPFDWTDVIRLDYSKPATRQYMTETMKWWLKETDIDGFRCDVAHMIPVDYWNECRQALDSVKQIFFLAESDQPFLHEKAFDMTYDWRFFHIMNDIAIYKKKAEEVFRHFNRVDSIYPENSYLMEFTSNHDENSWSGPEHERLGKGVKTFAVVAATVPGMLLIYNGQEAAFKRRLNFFDKDSIDWGHYKFSTFYRKLINLKHKNKALWNGEEGGEMIQIHTNQDTSVVAFVRQKDSYRVLVICNLRPRKLNVKLKDKFAAGTYKDIFTDKVFEILPKHKFKLEPWEYLVLENE
jgi:glycosidase